MELQQDFKELLALLNSQKVEYIIIGAHALAFHGAPRYTGDLDIFVRNSSENAERIMAVLREFGFGSIGLSEADFTEPDQVIQLGFPPVRIDLMTKISGVSWDEAAAGAKPGKYGDIPVKYMGREQFIANKRACGRAKDLFDIESLDK